MFGVAIAATVLALPGSVNAGQIHVQQSGYTVNVSYFDFGSRAEDNTVVAKVIMGGYGALVTDSTATITTISPAEASPWNQPCTLLDEHRALCVNPTPAPEATGGFPEAFLDMALGAGDNSFELDPDTIPPKLFVTAAEGDDVISIDNAAEAEVSDFDGSNTIRVGRTQRPAYVIGGQGPDRIDVKNGTGGDIVACSWRDDAFREGDRVRADRDDAIDADCR
ncbi:MAG TPA: hypothetical protein VF712_18450 [Thermoleophilaceae bacterium]|jgi:hypothetical protein